MKATYYPSTIVDILDEAPGVKRFFFNIQFPDFVFKPGQFVMVDLPIESKVTNRSYSIASAPNSTNTFELIIVLNPDGKGTPHMWDNYKIGDIVPISAPLGKFVLPEYQSTELCFIATGTGIAPFRSMVHHLLNQGQATHPIKLIFGCRTQRDLLYRAEMEALMAQYPLFSYIPVLSRADESWLGYKGYVHQVYENLYTQQPLLPVSFYLCGWKNMITEARERLVKMGYDKSHIKFELYD